MFQTLPKRPWYKRLAEILMGEAPDNTVKVAMPAKNGDGTKEVRYFPRGVPIKMSRKEAAVLRKLDIPYSHIVEPRRERG